jgi:hypothetical protein
MKKFTPKQTAHYHTMLHKFAHIKNYQKRLKKGAEANEKERLDNIRRAQKRSEISTFPPDSAPFVIPSP